MRDVLFDFHPFCCLTWNFSKFKIRIFFQHRPGWPVRSSCGCIWRMLWRYRGEAQVTNVTNHQTKQLWVGHFSANWSFRVFSVKGPKDFKGFPREPRWNHQPFGTTNCLLFGIDCLLVSALGTLDRGTTWSFRRSLVSRCFSLELHPSPLSSTFNAVVWDGLFIGIACRVLWDGSSDLKVFANREELDWWGWWGWWVEVPHKQTWNLQIIWLEKNLHLGLSCQVFQVCRWYLQFLDNWQMSSVLVVGAIPKHQNCH